MVPNHKQMRIGLGLLPALALIGLGCGLAEGLSRGPVSINQVEVGSLPTRTPWPTFTPTPEGLIILPSQTENNQNPAEPGMMPTFTPTPLPTATPVNVPPTDTPTPIPPLPTDTPPPAPTNTPAPPPPPPPTNTPAPPTKSPYQFSPGPWYAGDRNDAIVRFYGYLKDTNGNPVNGYSVKAVCGSTTILSFPSGPSNVAPDWAPGWYDIVANPIDCNWTLQVVEYQCDTPGYFDAQCKQFTPLSEAVPVSTNVQAGETIIVAEWIKHW